MNATLEHLCIAAGVVTLAALGGCDSKTAEEKGAAMATEKIDMAKGVGDALQAKGGQATEAVTTGLGSVVNGFEKGVQKSGRKIVSDDTVAKAGLKITRALDAAGGLDLYVVAEADAIGKMRVLAYDVLDNEIGRATVALVRSADEGKYVRVPMDEQVVLSSISRLAVSFKPGDALAKK